MRIGILAVMVFVLAAPEVRASLTLSATSQNFGLTGIGPNAQGQGQALMSWGSCVPSGATTVCTLSGTYTASPGTATLGESGTYAFVVSYAGSGKFPLNALYQTPNYDYFVAAATSNYKFVLTLTPANLPPVNFYSFYNFTFMYGAGGATCTGVPATGCSGYQVGQTPTATITGPVIPTFDPTPVISNNGVISASNYGNGYAAIAPSTWIEIYGYNLANVQSQVWAGSDFVGTQAPATLGGTQVTVGGQPAYVYFVTPGQLNVQVPSNITAGLQPLVVTTAGGSSVSYTVQVNTVEPGVLAPPAFNISGNQNVVALKSNTLTYILPVNAPGVATARARVGDSLTMYGIGFGTVTPSIPAGQVVEALSGLTNTLQITFGGMPCTITYQGLTPGYVGLYQFNVTVPNIPANDTTPVVFSVNGTPVPQKLVIAIAN
jgi:uncharacterized protein (TIGR03437 family)